MCIARTEAPPWVRELAPWAGIFLAAFVWRFLLIGLFPGLYSFDGFTRLWDQHTLFVRHWLPLPQLLVYLMGEAGGSIEILRLAFAGVGSAGAAFMAAGWARLVDFRSGVIFGLALAFLPIFVQYSVVPYQEGFLLLFAGVALCTWPATVQEENRPHTWVAIGSLALAELCRYEGWMLAVLLIAGACLRRRWSLALRTSIVLLIPVLWLATAPWRPQGSGPPRVHAPIDVNLLQLGFWPLVSSMFAQAGSFLAVTYTRLTLVSLGLAAWGISRAVPRRDLVGVEMVLFLLGLFAVTLLRGVVTTGITGRMLILPCAMLLAFAAMGLIDLARRLPGRWDPVLAWGALAALLLVFTPRGYYAAAIGPRAWLPEAIAGEALVKLPADVTVRVVPRPIPNLWGESALGAIFAHHVELDAHHPRWRFGRPDGPRDDTDVILYWHDGKYRMDSRVPLDALKSDDGG